MTTSGKYHPFQFEGKFVSLGSNLKCARPNFVPFVPKTFHDIQGNYLAYVLLFLYLKLLSDIID